VRRLLTMLAAMPLICGALAVTPAWAGTADASYLLAQTDALRAANGLPGYAEVADLDAVAAGQADAMAASSTLYHNPQLASAVCCWSWLGENVGYGFSAAVVEAALVASPPHLANLLSVHFDQIGIGTARSADGTLYIDEVFRQVASSGSAPLVRAAPPVASRSTGRAPLVTYAAPARTAVAPRTRAAVLPSRQLLAMRLRARLDWVRAVALRRPRDPIAAGQNFWWSLNRLAG